MAGGWCEFGAPLRPRPDHQTGQFREGEASEYGPPMLTALLSSLFEDGRHLGGKQRSVIRRIQPEQNVVGSLHIHFKLVSL